LLGFNSITLGETGLCSVALKTGQFVIFSFKVLATDCDKGFLRIEEEKKINNQFIDNLI
jgi:hypothetical protein